GEVHETNEALNFDVVEPRARGLAQPRELLIRRRRHQRLRGVLRMTVARPQVRVDADDLRLARRQRQNLRRATTDQERRTWALHRLRLSVELGHGVVLALE